MARENVTMVSKDQLVERYHGGPNGPRREGTRVRLVRDVLMAPGQPWEWTARAGEYVVKDLMARRTYNKPDRVGIGPQDRGIAFSARLTDLELA